ncbi:hypothetical protein BU15DRAFT_68062 [Melanogaster broomeanus]|nr:hypothetical protein BU15DRAFT_68062 [Melanogaster broomeanus]
MTRFYYHNHYRIPNKGVLNLVIPFSHQFPANEALPAASMHADQAVFDEVLRSLESILEDSPSSVRSADGTVCVPLDDIPSIIFQLSQKYNGGLGSLASQCCDLWEITTVLDHIMALSTGEPPLVDATRLLPIILQVALAAVTMVKGPSDNLVEDFKQMPRFLRGLTEVVRQHRQADIAALEHGLANLREEYVETKASSDAAFCPYASLEREIQYLQTSLRTLSARMTSNEEGLDALNEIPGHISSLRQDLDACGVRLSVLQKRGSTSNRLEDVNLKDLERSLVELEARLASLTKEVGHTFKRKTTLTHQVSKWFCGVFMRLVSSQSSLDSRIAMLEKNAELMRGVQVTHSRFNAHALAGVKGLSEEVNKLQRHACDIDFVDASLQDLRERIDSLRDNLEEFKGEVTHGMQPCFALQSDLSSVDSLHLSTITSHLQVQELREDGLYASSIHTEGFEGEPTDVLQQNGVVTSIAHSVDSGLSDTAHVELGNTSHLLLQPQEVPLYGSGIGSMAELISCRFSILADGFLRCATSIIDPMCTRFFRHIREQVPIYAVYVRSNPVAVCAFLSHVLNGALRGWRSLARPLIALLVSVLVIAAAFVAVHFMQGGNQSYIQHDRPLWNALRQGQQLGFM